MWRFPPVRGGGADKNRNMPTQWSILRGVALEVNEIYVTFLKASNPGGLVDFEASYGPAAQGPDLVKERLAPPTTTTTTSARMPKFVVRATIPS